MAERRKNRGLIALGVVVLAVVLVVALWDWNWFRPLVAREASAALGREVTIGHFNVKLGRVTTLIADDVTIANPKDFPADAALGGDRFGKINALTVRFGLWDYIRHRTVVIPQITVDHPTIDARQLANGEANWSFTTAASAKKPADEKPSTPPEIGSLQIDDGTVRVVSAKLKADMTLAVATRAGADGGQIVVDAKGTYAAQPITGRFVGGALLTLRDAGKPYPVDLQVANGATHVALVGTVQNPLDFAGARLKLDLAGADMSQLFPLTGVPIPQTPPYKIAGNFDYDRAAKTFKFTGFSGIVGRSDLEGDISVALREPRPLVVADLSSRQVNLDDLAGFIGSQPGEKNSPNETPAQRAAIAKAEASPQVIPNTPINMPKVKAADIRLHYKGAHIEGRSIPFDTLTVGLFITDGNIKLDPLDLGIGRGAIASTIDLENQGDVLHENFAVDFRQIDLSRLMQATHAFGGAGIIGGSAKLVSTGNSLATILGRGNGELQLYMNEGGDLSALLIDLSGFQFGNSLLSAIGVPTRAKIRCLISDFALTDGVLNTKVLALDTTEADVHGAGWINLRDETMNYRIQTVANHFTIGSLPAPIDITGTFRSPSIRPDIAALGIRGGLAVGLGVLFPPLALLPTIQLGLGAKNDCGELMRGAK